METIYNTLCEGQAEAKKKIIRDDDYLRFVPIKKTLQEMEVGDILVWPDHKHNSVRLMAGRIKKECGKIYKCVKNRKDKTAEICRIA